jgi:hypothetical protein
MDVTLHKEAELRRVDLFCLRKHRLNPGPNTIRRAALELQSGDLGGRR